MVAIGFVICLYLKKHCTFCIADDKSLHILALSDVCRVCCKKLKGKYPQHKTLFKEEFLTQFNVDISQENHSIYPENVCPNHASQFYKLRRDSNYKCSMQMFDFTSLYCEHGKPCNLCQEKRKRHMPASSNVAGKSTKTDKEFVCDQFLKMDVLDQKAVVKTIVAKSDQCIKDYMLLCLGNYVSQSVTNDDVPHKAYCDIDFLRNIDFRQYLSTINPTLIGFLGTIIGIDPLNLSSEHDKQLLISWCFIMESIYKLKYKKCIGPVSFMVNLSLLQATGSRLAVEMIGALGAGSKYTNILKWLREVGSSVPPTCPNGDVVMIFDNEQTIGKSWNICPNNKVKVSVITNVAAAQVSPTTTLQMDEKLLPMSWCKVEGNENKILTELIKTTSETNKKHRKLHYDQMYFFLDAIIDHVVKEQRLINDINVDDVDIAVDKEITQIDFKQCHKCHKLYDRSKRKCTACKVDLPKGSVEKNSEESQEQQPILTEFITKTDNESETKQLHNYEHIESSHAEEGIKVKVLDPVFVNPNSLETLAMVLRHIGLQAGLARYGGTTRQWVTVCCDGLPYGLILKLIEDWIVCEMCNNSFMNQSSFNDHCKSSHIGNDDVKYYHEFDWVLLKTGDGHFEMNLMKAFMELNWDVCMESMAKRMGWRSDAALASAKKCHDNHKTWQLLLTFHLGTMMELVVPYVRSVIGTDDRPTVKDFISYAKGNSNPNFQYMFLMTTRYSQAILNLRMGVRRNNSHVIQSAKYMANELFHGRCHPKYQFIEIMDSFQRLVMPERLREFVENHESMTRDGSQQGKSRGQGYDFILEEENREIKHWIRHGVADNQTWQSICRNSEFLKELKNTILCFGQQRNIEAELKIDDAILDWRTFLRKTQYLSQETHLHTSVCGKPLHPQLINYQVESERKRNYRILQILLKQDPPSDCTLHQPIAVTQEEHNEITAFHKKTIEEIDHIILDIIQGLNDKVLQQELLKQFKKSVINAKKDAHLQFFEHVTSLYQESLKVVEVNITEESQEM